jgi:hypothetical protein
MPLVLIGLLLTAMPARPLWAAAPQVTIVVDPQAPRLERLAAEELSAIVKKLTNGDAKIAPTLQASQEPAILLGSPKTNPELAQTIGKAWPELSEQGLVLKSIKQGNRNLLVVGGGSPAATLWAAYELGHRHGVRYLMHSDIYPTEPVPLKIAGLDVVMEPAVKVRSLVLLGDSPVSTSSWSLAEHERLLMQLAKLKFNRIVLNVGSSGLFTTEETDKQGLLWNGQAFKIDGETAGRAAFRGANEFANPDLATARSAAELRQACLKLASGIQKHAADLGMDVVETNASAKSPNVGVINNGLALPVMFTQAVTSLLLEPSPEGQPFALDPMPAGDLNPAVYYFSRAGFGGKAEQDDVYRELFEAVCSHRDVADRLVRGFQQMQEGARILGQHAPSFAMLKRDSLVAEFRTGRTPDWFKQVKEHYTQSMIEMFRARDNCRPDTRPLLYYYCKRGEFAVEYLNCVEAVQQAGAAKRGGDAEKCIEWLEKGVESLYNGINALSEVAGDQSDRALIAVLNERAYRPLVREFEAELAATE